MKFALFFATAMIVPLFVAATLDAQPAPPATSMVTRRVQVYTPKPYADAIRDISADEIAKRVSEAYNKPFSENTFVPGGSTEDFAFGDQRFSIERILTDNSVEFRIEVHSPTDDSGAAADKTVEVLKSILVERIALTTKQLRSQVNDASRQIGDLEQKRDKVTALLDLRRQQLASAGDPGLASASIESIRAMARELDKQLETTALDIAGKTARQQALAVAVEKLSKQMDEKLADDPIAQQLQAVVDVKQKQLDIVKQAQAQATASNADLQNAIGELAQAKAVLLERHEAAAKAAVGDSLDTWNREMLTISIDLAELNARSDAIKSRIETLNKVMQTVGTGPSEEDLRSELDKIARDTETTMATVLYLNEASSSENTPKIEVYSSPPTTRK